MCSHSWSQIHRGSSVSYGSACGDFVHRRASRRGHTKKNTFIHRGKTNVVKFTETRPYLVDLLAENLCINILLGRGQNIYISYI